MDVSVINKNCIKIKGKKTAFIVDPEKDTPKTSADAVLLTRNSGFDISRVSGSRVVLNGPGEYEVNGSKISAVATTEHIIYKLLIDNTTITLGRSVDFSKLDGNFTACEIVLLNACDEFSESSITSLEPKIVVLYGDKKTEKSKKLGENNIISVVKFSTTKDKLPEKMEVVVLG